MSSLLVTVQQNLTPKLSIQWIADRRSDLLFYIGGALAGYAMYYLHAGLHLDMLTVWIFWVIFLDTPHFFGTYLRTYFDREEWQNRKPLLIGSLAWLLAGPLVLTTSYGLNQAGLGFYRAPFFFFILFFNLWAYWHVVRQHFGIMSLYKKKNADFHPRNNIIDKQLLYGGLLAPLAAFIVRHPEARMAFGLHGLYPPFPSLQNGLVSFSQQLHWEHLVVVGSVMYLVFIISRFIVRQIERWNNGLALNFPKILFFIALIPLHSLICYSDAVLTAPLLAFSAFVTIYHDVQYHAIVWFYSRNRYHKPGVDQKRFGLAPLLSGNFAIYAFSAVAMGAVMRLFGCSFEIHEGCHVLVMTSSVPVFADFTTKDLLYSIFIGIPMHHYFVDQYIWRPSRDKGLQQDLKLDAQKSK